MANLRNAPPATPGNRRHVTHGGYARIASERLEARELEVFDALSLDVPLRGPDGGAPRHDTVVIRRFAEVLCRLDDVKSHISAHGWADSKGEPRRVVEVEARLRREALALAEALGCTPRSRAKLGLSLQRTASLAEAMSEDDPDRRRELYRQLDGDVTAVIDPEEEA